MKRAFVAVLVSVFLVAAVSVAGEKTSETDSWWAKLRAKVEKLTPAKPAAGVTAAGGVRGAKNESESLYWKGKDLEKQAASEELESFKVALDYASAGKSAEAIRGFEDYLKKYPSGALADDAKTALKRLQGR